jgi:hypothetical protein
VYGFGYRENWHRMSELGINSEVEKNPWEKFIEF